MVSLYLDYKQGATVDGQNPAWTLRTLNYGNYGIFLIMGTAGFCPSTVVSTIPSRGAS